MLTVHMSMQRYAVMSDFIEIEAGSDAERSPYRALQRHLDSYTGRTRAAPTAAAQVCFPDHLGWP